ncbi:MAG: PAS domain S-box-containing protein [Maribacter sp.]|jgi:PAS domain S-box-containing protein
MKRYHRLLNRQLKKTNLTNNQLDNLAPFLEQINEAYVAFDNDLNQTENVLEKSSQELFLANKRLISKIDAVSNRLSKVAENIKDVIFEIDLEGNWKYLNPAWEKLSGYTVAECLGKPFYEKSYTLDGEHIINLIDLEQLNLNIQRNVLQVQTAHKETKWVDVSVKGIINKTGTLEGYIGTIVDISDLKKTEIELLNAKEKETLANLAKDDFLSTMSHEIRTPLNAVIGISHLLLLENPKPEQLENLQTLKYSSEHLLGLVNDILDFNKISSGSLDLEKVEFSVTHLLKGIQGIFINRAKAKNIRFAIKKDNLLPDVLMGDSVRISQILTNLVSNALKFTEKGKVTLDLEIAAETEETCLLEVFVRDTGIGIPLEKQERIFQSFAQANSDTTRIYGGTGLGLAICRQLLELMGSTLHVDSAEGKGSTFSFLLQLNKGKKESTLTSNNEHGLLEGKDAPDLVGVKILVAEDNKVNIMVIKKFLSKWHVDYDIAENGEIAFEMAKQNSYDLVLMDLQMPVMNGFTSCKLIKESSKSLNRNIPIYALSASTGADIKNEIKDNKIDGLISKPFNSNELHQKLSDIIKEARAKLKSHART